MDIALSSVVIYAFAVEVYFKCLIRLETGANPRFEHRLIELFGDLSANTQARIRQEYNRLYATDPALQTLASIKHPSIPSNHFDFDKTLDDASELFFRFRYFYEPFQKVTNPEVIGMATRTIILQDHPDWLSRAKYLETLPTFHVH